MKTTTIANAAIVATAVLTHRALAGTPDFISLNPEQPSECRDATLDFKQTFEVGTDFLPIDLRDEKGGAYNLEGAKWTFKIMNPGIIWADHVEFTWTDQDALNDPTGEADPFLSQDANSTMTDRGSVDNRNGTLTFTVGPSSAWQYVSVRLGTLNDTSGLDSGWIAANISVAGTYKCTSSPPASTCDENSLEKNAKGWEDWNVDDWFWDYMRNVSGVNDDSPHDWDPMLSLAKDFSIGNNDDCSYNKICDIIKSCDEITPNANGDHDAAVYLVFTSLQNFSDMIWTLWSFFNQETWNAAETADNLISIFDPPTSGGPRPWYQVLGQGTAIFGMFSAFVGLIPGASEIMAVPNAINTLAGSMGAATGAAYAAAKDLNFEYSKDFGLSLSNLQSTTTEALQDLHQSIFQKGDSVTHLLYGGVFADRTSLGIDNDEILTQAQNWLEQYITLRLINDMWKQHNVFVTYMPYTNDSDDSVVAWWDGSRDGGNNELRSFRKFTQEDCEKEFLPDSADRIACATSDWGLTTITPGMFRLNIYSDKVLQEGGNLNFNDRPPGWDKNYKINGTGYVFAPMDALKSAVLSFDQGGFNFDAASNFMAQATDENDANADAFAALGKIGPASAGMFNFPVCTSYDMSSWPSSNPDMNTLSGLCACNLDSASDKWGNPFRFNANEDIVKFIEKTGPNLEKKGCYAWNGDISRNDFTDIRGQWTGPCNETCYPVWPPA